MPFKNYVQCSKCGRPFDIERLELWRNRIYYNCRLCDYITWDTFYDYSGIYQGLCCQYDNEIITKVEFLEACVLIYHLNDALNRLYRMNDVGK